MYQVQVRVLSQLSPLQRLSGDEFNFSFLHTVASLFSELKKAYTVGLGGARWSEEVHPKYWYYLGLGPHKHSFGVDKSDPNSGPLDALVLKVQEPMSSELLNHDQYAQVLLKRSMSVNWLSRLLQPLVDCFQQKIDANSDTVECNNNGMGDENARSREEVYSDATEDDELMNVLSAKPLSFDI